MATTNTNTAAPGGWSLTWRLLAALTLYTARRADWLAWLPLGLLAAALLPGAGSWDTLALLVLGAAWVFFLVRTQLGQRFRAWLVSIRRAAPTVRRARRSLTAAGIGTPERPARVSGRATPSGVVLKIRTPLGVPDSAVHDRAEALASDLGALSVRPIPEEFHGLAMLLVQYSDPLADPLGAPGWVSGPGTTTDLVAPAPIGRAEDGSTVALSLWSTSLLVAGLPGAGKSVVERLALAYAGCDPSALLVGADLKPGALEMSNARARFAVLASNAGEFNTALRRVWAEIHRRAPLLAAEGLRKVPTDRRAEFPPIVVVVDEAGQIAAEGPAGAEALATLAEILRIGRAFGVTVIAATQHPTAESFGNSTAARSLFAHRVCLAVSNASAAAVVLGENPAEVGLDPWTYPNGSGIGVVKDAAASRVWERMRRFRAYHLEEDDADALLLRAAEVRREWLAANPGAVSDLPAPFAGDVAEDAETIGSESKRRRRYRKPRASGGGE